MQLMQILRRSLIFIGLLSVSSFFVAAAQNTFSLLERKGLRHGNRRIASRHFIVDDKPALPVGRSAPPAPAPPVTPLNGSHSWPPQELVVNNLHYQRISVDAPVKSNGEDVTVTKYLHQQTISTPYRHVKHTYYESPIYDDKGNVVADPFLTAAVQQNVSNRRFKDRNLFSRPGFQHVKHTYYESPVYDDKGNVYVEGAGDAFANHNQQRTKQTNIGGRQLVTTTTTQSVPSQPDGGIVNTNLLSTTLPGTLFQLNLMDDFDLFNPRKDSNAFKFSRILNDGGQQEITLDGFGFVKTDENRLLLLLSVPFRSWQPQSQMGTRAAIDAGVEAAVETRQPLNVSPNQTLRVALRFTCRTINTQLHSFGTNVSNSNDDERLARCGFSLRDRVFESPTGINSGTGIEFGIFATNEGVWGTYSRQRSASTNGFDIYRRLASRASPTELVNARMEYDRRLNETRYYLNNRLLWAINQVGGLSPAILDDVQNRVVSNWSAPAAGGSLAAQEPPASLSLIFSVGHKMDVTDALRPQGSSNVPLVKYTQQPDYYPIAANFVDSTSQRTSSLYGQGSVFGIKRLVVKRYF